MEQAKHAAGQTPDVPLKLRQPDPKPRMTRLHQTNAPQAGGGHDAIGKSAKQVESYASEGADGGWGRGG